MMSQIEFQYFLPLPMGEITRLASAFKTLVGEEPELWLGGYIDTTDGETIFATTSDVPVTKCGRRYLHAETDGEVSLVDPAAVRNDWTSRPRLTLRQK